MLLGRRITGSLLNREWRIGARHTLYREDGRWYHRLERFPGALCDSGGYIVFKTQEDFQRCRYLSIGAEVNVPLGISAIPGYVRVH